MIRDALFSDIPALMGLMRASHARSKYAGLGVSLVEKAMDQMFMGLVAGQKQNGPQASFLQVVNRDGKVVGFMAGSLNRIYNVGDKLGANDVFLINEGRHLKDALQLIDNYIAWARSNPKVIEIGLSWSDAIPHAKSIADIYRSKGATLVGEQFEIRVDIPFEVAA